MTSATRALTLTRLAYGAVLLLAPTALLARLTRFGLDRRARLVARVLGVRELLQAELVRRRPTRGRQLAGAGVDAVHAASMIALARADQGRRRAALHNAASAVLLALGGLAGARSAGRQ